MTIPLRFCWSKMGVEAGETIEAIIERKEDERRRNGGLFLWGVGNALGPSISPLVRKERNPELLFSPIKSPPRSTDVSPGKTILWRAGETIDGFEWELPTGSIVTSRDNTRGYHYALVCSSKKPLRLLAGKDQIDVAALRNLRTGGALGSSQVTAVVERHEQQTTRDSTCYPVVLRVNLAQPYFVRLTDGIAVPQTLATKLQSGRMSSSEKFAQLSRLRGRGRKPIARDLFEDIAS
jgi:hypothetical protein